MPGLIKVGGAWKNIDPPKVKVAGVWKDVDTGFVKVAGVWKEWFTGVPPLAPGEYTLNATSQSLGSTSGFAEFDTALYRGRITAIWCQVSWTTQLAATFTLGVTGRTSGNFYRNIQNSQNEWNGSTINHRIDTWDAASLTEFNDGSAIGFTYSEGGSTPINSKISTTRLRLEIS